MKIINRIKVMKFFSYTCIFLILYVATFFARYKLFKLQNTLWFIMLFAILLGGYVAGTVFPKFRKPIILFSYTILLLATILLNMDNSAPRAIFELAVSFLSFYISFSIAGKSYYKILDSGVFTVGLLVMITTSAFGNKTNQVQLFIIFLVYITLSFILINQGVVDKNILKSNGEKAYGFEGFWVHNALILTVISISLICLLFLLQIPLSQIDLPNIGSIWNSNTVPITKPYSPPKFPGANFKQPVPRQISDSTATFILLIIISLAVLLIVFLIFKYRKNIIKLFLKHDKKKKTKEYKEFILEEEMLDRNLNYKPAEIKNMKAPKTIKRHLDLMKKVTNPVDKLRYLYGMLLDILITRNVEINKWDTTGEIFDKAKPLEELSGFAYNITKEYNSTRYGEKVPSADYISSFEKEVQKIIEKL